MNVAEYISSNPTHVFSKYIVNVASAMNLDLSKLGVEEFDSCIENPEPSVVNPILFKHLGKLAEVQADATESIVSQYTFPEVNINLDTELERLARSIRSSTRAAEDYYRQYSSHMGKVSTERIIRDRYVRMVEEGVNIDNLETQITRIERDGWWKFLHLSNGYLYFQSGPVFQREYNPAAGVDIGVDFGQYMILVPLECTYASIAAYPMFMNTVMFGRAPSHPHIGSSGQVCWGDASDGIANYMATKDFVSSLELIRALFMTYEPSNPYTALVTFSNNTYRIPTQTIKIADYHIAISNAIPDPRYGEIKIADHSLFRPMTFWKQDAGNDNDKYYLMLGSGRKGITFMYLGKYDRKENLISNVYHTFSLHSPADYDSQLLNEIEQVTKIPDDLWEAHLKANEVVDSEFNRDLYLNSEILVYGLDDQYSMFNGMQVTYLRSDRFMYEGALFQTSASFINLRSNKPLLGTNFADHLSEDESEDDYFEREDIIDMIVNFEDTSYEFGCHDSECGYENYLEDTDYIVEGNFLKEYEVSCRECGYNHEGSNI